MTAAITALPTGTTDTILDRAADYLARHGWNPTSLYDSHENCTHKCRVHRTGLYPASMVGAIRVAVFGRPRWYLDTADGQGLHDYTAAVEWLNTYLIAHGHAGLHAPVFDWQAAAGRTLIDVTSGLHAAATAYRHHARRSAV
ncbi:DUF6197 family protein [Jidongwangia harbinensis]|uniref:DUF6197 family protein n=1 Tax=Jidongwangia harbinensis TaxID=2878561 RepID=UPI001CDA4C6B|nr:hypothetical protein [Jidongwangia harbinensis]MCA2219520.1 hypothetical protein [Jidongwangia harbinensis]